MVEGRGNGYLRTACDYVHLNSVRAGLLQPGERLLAYPWSSVGYYLAAPEHRPEWIRVDRLLGEHGLGGDTPEARQAFEQRMEARRWEPGDEQGLEALRRGWCLGSAEFRAQMVAKAAGLIGEHHFAQLRCETARAKAERILAEELSRLGWQPSELTSRAKSDPAKLRIAERIRRQTTLTIKQIAALVHLGTARSASVRLHLAMRQTTANPPAPSPFGV